MIGTALPAATPGLARLGLYVIGGLPGILTVVVAIHATRFGFMLLAKIRYRQAILTNPYWPIIGLFLLGRAFDFVGIRSAAWLWQADRIVSVR